MVNTVVCFVLVLNACSPISDLWNTTKTNRNCRPQRYQAHIAWANSAVGIFTDLCIMCLPIWIIVKNLRSSRTKALQVSLVFCVAFVSIICACIRLALIITIDLGVDTTFKFPRIAAWTEAELHLGFWVACVPAVKPLLRLASFRLGLRTSPDSTGHRGRGDTKYRVPSRVSSPQGFHESLAGATSFGGRSKEVWGSKTSTQVEIELVDLDNQRGRTK